MTSFYNKTSIYAKKLQNLSSGQLENFDLVMLWTHFIKKKKAKM